MSRRSVLVCDRCGTEADTERRRAGEAADWGMLSWPCNGGPGGSYDLCPPCLTVLVEVVRTGLPMLDPVEVAP